MLAALLFVLGVGLLVAGAELLVRGASRLAIAAGVSPLVVGLTVVAFGTSSPELAVTVGGALDGRADIALGNVVGSNIVNVLLILGLSAAVAPLLVDRRLVRFDVPVMVAVSLAAWLVALDGSVGRLEGLAGVGLLVAYTVFLVRVSRRETAALRAEYAEAVEAEEGEPRGWWRDAGLVVAGLVLLVVGADWLVDGAVAAATALGVSELVVGLTIVAAGTSLPELATSVLASLRGERDIAVGNVVGSNLFNLLGVLGVGAALTPGGVAVAPAALAFDIPVMVVVAFACLPVFFTGWAIERWEGILLVAYYGAYVAYLVLQAGRHPALPGYGAAMLHFVLPLTALTLGVLVVRAARRLARRR